MEWYTYPSTHCKMPVNKMAPLVLINWIFIYNISFMILINSMFEKSQNNKPSKQLWMIIKGHNVLVGQQKPTRLSLHEHNGYPYKHMLYFQSLNGGDTFFFRCSNKQRKDNTRRVKWQREPTEWNLWHVSVC